MHQIPPGVSAQWVGLGHLLWRSPPSTYSNLTGNNQFQGWTSLVAERPPLFGIEDSSSVGLDSHLPAPNVGGWSPWLVAPSLHGFSCFPQPFPVISGKLPRWILPWFLLKCGALISLGGCSQVRLPHALNSSHSSLTNSLASPQQLPTHHCPFFSSHTHTQTTTIALLNHSTSLVTSTSLFAHPKVQPWATSPHLITKHTQWVRRPALTLVPLSLYFVFVPSSPTLGWGPKRVTSNRRTQSVPILWKFLEVQCTPLKRTLPYLI